MLKCTAAYIGEDEHGKFREFVFKCVRTPLEFGRCIRDDSNTETYTVGKYYEMRLEEIENDNSCSSAENEAGAVSYNCPNI